MTIKERIGFVTLTLAAALVGGAVSGHIFAARAVDAAAAPKLMTAQKFMLVDAKGNTRGEFNVTHKGVAQLAVFDGTGTLRAGLGVGSDGAPALGIFGRDGKPRIEVGLTNSIARIQLYNANAQPQASLGVAPDGQSVWTSWTRTAIRAPRSSWRPTALPRCVWPTSTARASVST